ncbi:unnamed protein product, partial [Rotaria sp. Silwood2]
MSNEWYSKQEESIKHHYKYCAIT